MTKYERQFIEAGEEYAREQLELQENMPEIMTWITTHAWIVNRVVRVLRFFLKVHDVSRLIGAACQFVKGHSKEVG